MAAALLDKNKISSRAVAFMAILSVRKSMRVEMNKNPRSQNLAFEELLFVSFFPPTVALYASPYQTILVMSQASLPTSLSSSALLLLRAATCLSSPGTSGKDCDKTAHCCLLAFIRDFGLLDPCLCLGLDCGMDCL